MADRTQKLIGELRRGTLVLSVLSQLQERQYGYSLNQALAMCVTERIAFCLRWPWVAGH